MKVTRHGPHTSAAKFQLTCMETLWLHCRASIIASNGTSWQELSWVIQHCVPRGRKMMRQQGVTLMPSSLTMVTNAWRSPVYFERTLTVALTGCDAEMGSS